MKNIHNRGHEIGLHPSYDSKDSKDILIAEYFSLLKVCNILKINQTSWGSRMHYLRWNPINTLRLLDEIGVDHDSSLGYADSAGFRCGTCFEYQGFDHINSVLLKFE